MGTTLLASIIEEGYLDPAGDDWHKLGLVSKATRQTGAEFIIESLYKEMEQAGGIEEFLKQHKQEIINNNTERRRKFLKYEQEEATKAQEDKQQGKEGKSQSSSQRIIVRRPEGTGS